MQLTIHAVYFTTEYKYGAVAVAPEPTLSDVKNNVERSVTLLAGVVLKYTRINTEYSTALQYSRSQS